MRDGVGREPAANPNSPARLSSVFNPQKFPSASGALGTRATKRPCARQNKQQVRTATPLRAPPQPGRRRQPFCGRGRPRRRTVPGLRIWRPRAGWGPPAALRAGTCRHPPATRHGQAGAALGPPHPPSGLGRQGRHPVPSPRGSRTFGSCPWPGSGDPRGGGPPAWPGHGLPAAHLRGRPPPRGAGRLGLGAGTSIFGGDQATA